MSDIQAKRNIVKDLYPSVTWKWKVANMSDEQVVAIYLSHRNNPKQRKRKNETPTQRRLF